MFVRYQQLWSEKQAEELQRLSELTQLPKTELVRRFFDFCTKENNLNELIPAMSGHLTVGRQQ